MQNNSELLIADYLAMFPQRASKGPTNNTSDPGKKQDSEVNYRRSYQLFSTDSSKCSNFDNCNE